MNPYQILDVPETATPEQIRKAYHDMARRWHPDRFQKGPERDWANEKMSAINAAYKEICDHANRVKRDEGVEKALLTDVQRMIDSGRYTDARKTLMGLSTRCAEWNYLFGALLLATRETEKALIYLSVAAHQSPGTAKYARAFREAQQRAAGLTGRLSALLLRRRSGV